MSFRGVLLSVGLWLLAIGGYAQSPNCRIDHFSRELSSRYVEDIAQDRTGFVYLATRNGLCRYDGHEFRFFKSYPDDACRLSHNRINTIEVSSLNNLWCLAHDLKCYLFDPETERFYDPLSAVGCDSYPLIEAIYTLPDGITYLVGQQWVVRVNEKTLDKENPAPSAFDCYRLGGEQLAGKRVISVAMDGEGNEWILTDSTVKVIGQDKRIEQIGTVAMCVAEDAVWLAERNGLLSRYANGAVEPRHVRMPQGHGAVRNIQLIARGVLGIATEEGLSIYRAASNRFEFVPLEGGKVNRFRVDSHGVLWIFTEREGLYRHDPATGKTTYLKNRTEDNLAENENEIFWYEEAQGRVYVVPTRGVLSYYNPEEERLELLAADNATEPYKGHTRRFLVDHQRNIWCAEVEGVSRIAIMSGAFQHEVLQRGSDTRAIHQDRSGRIWFSLRDRQIFIYDNRFNRIGYLTADGRISPTPTTFGSPIYCFHEDEDGVLWLGSRFDGLYRLLPIDENRYRVEQYRMKATDRYSLSDDNIYDIHRDRYGRLWVATYGGGLNLVEESGTQLRFLHAGNDLPFPVERHHQLRVIEETPHNIMLGSTNGLVYFPNRELPLDAIRFRSCEVQENGSGGLLSNDVRDIHYTSAGEIYLLTFSGGLSRVRMQGEDEPKFEHYTQKEGLPSEQVLSMIEDANGGQWILSETLAFRFDPVNNHFETFGERYSGEDFYFSEAKPLLHGDYLLAGVSDGFCVVPTSETVSQFEPRLALTELTIEGRTERRGVGNLHEVCLKSHERDLQLAFTALDYVNPSSIRYAYRLEGENETWQHLGKQRNIHFVDLRAGDYTLVIRSTNSNGRWVGNDYRLRIVVAPTFWETGWAWLLYGVLFVVLLYAAVSILQLRSRVAMEQHLSDIKLRFFTDISHELRTPLTLISTPVEMLLNRENLSDQGRDQMMVIRRNTQRLMTLVNQILDFRKIESKKMRLLLEQTDVVAIVRQSMMHFHLLAKEHNIEYHLDAIDEHIVGWVDRDKVEKILFNLLSNAFKYTPDGKAITVRVTKVDEWLTLEVMDEGVGMDESMQHRLFQRFETLSQANLFKPSSGIGLSLVNELVQLLGGDIEVKSTPSVGSCFTVTLPLEKAVFNNFNHADFLLGEHEGVEQQPRGGEHGVENVQSMDAEAMQLDTRSTVLVVEDNEELRSMLRAILAEEYRVLEASDGLEGLTVAREQLPDLILSDVLMPNMDGLDMVRHLRENPRTARISIVLLSAKATLDDRISGLEEGVDDYLPKPFHASYLVARIRSILERRREMQQRLLAELSAANEAEPIEDESVSPEIRFLHQATAVIERHLDDCDWTIEAFASEMCLSHTALFQKLKMAVGISPLEFVREIRLKKACQLICEGDHNIASISYMVGFSDPKYFTRVFKKRFGIPPSQYGERLGDAELAEEAE